jgi:hypothetical protein
MINQINDINQYAKRSAAGVFKLYSEYIHFGENLIAGIKDLENIGNFEERKRRFRLRELIMLQKVVVADEAPAMIRKAISFFGGHGIMEDFLSLPRFHRDSMIMELWEGPRNLLLTQIHRDFIKVREWYPADEFVRDLLKGAENDKVEDVAFEFLRIMTHDSLLSNDEDTLEICRAWENLSERLVQAYQEQALTELNYIDKVPKFTKLKRQFAKKIKEQAKS